MENTQSVPEKPKKLLTLDKLLQYPSASVIPDHLRDAFTIQMLRELKSLNSKLSFIVFIIILGILFQLLASCGALIN